MDPPGSFIKLVSVHLAKTYGDKIGKASVTGYCIKFKTLKDINLDVIEAAIRDGYEARQ